MALQQQMGFGAAEGSYDERRSRLGMALIVVNADLYLSEFVEWVFNFTHGGLEGELVKSYSELARRPWGLCCSPEKAEKTVKFARSLGLIKIEEHFAANRAQLPNSYTIDWEGIAAILSERGRSSRRPSVTTRRAPGGPIDPPGGPIDPPGGPIDPPGGPIDPPFTTSFQTSFQTSLEPPPPPSLELPTQCARDGGWEEVVEVLKSLKMGDALGCCQRAAAHGVAPNEVAALLAFYQAAPGGWTLNYLHYRIRSAAPGEPADSRWPPPASPIALRTRDPTLDAENRRGSLIRSLKQRGLTHPEAVAEAERMLRAPRASTTIVTPGVETCP